MSSKKFVPIRVSVIVPCYQEVNYIEDFINNFFLLDFADLSVELIIADGLSDDGTEKILEEFKSLNSSLKVIKNPKRIVSTGLNLAVLSASGEIIIRMDVHTKYARDYIVKSVKQLITTDAECVGGPWTVFKPNQGIGRAIALAFESKIGSGNAKSRDISYSGPSDTVYLGCWWKAYLIKIGLFDEELVRNQDDELCLRIRNSGGKIYQSSEIKSTYFPRTEYTKLFNQWKQYGFWRPFVVMKHKSAGSMRQFIPAFFVIFLFATVLLSYFFNSFSPIAFFAAVYFLSITISFKNQYPQEDISVLFKSIYAIFLIHFGYGVGFIRGSLFAVLSINKSLSSKNKISR